MARRRKMSAKQRRYFAPRRARRRASSSSGRRVSRRRSNGGGGSGLGRFIPGSMRENAVRFGAGFSMPYVNSFVAPYTDGVLSVLGDYKDEGRNLVIGAAAYGFGSGLIREAGKAYWDYGVTSSGIQTASGMNIGTTATSGAGAQSGGAGYAW